MWHIENFDYRSNSPCKSSVQLNVSRKGVWPINSRCSLISLNLAKDKFGKGGVEGLLSGLYRSSYCSKTRSALYLWGFIYSLTALGRQPNNLPKYFWCNFRLLFILQSIANREDWLSLFQLSQLFYSFKGLWCRLPPLQLFGLDSPSSSELPSQFKVSKFYPMVHIFLKAHHLPCLVGTLKTGSCKATLWSFPQQHGTAIHVHLTTLQLQIFLLAILPLYEDNF